MSASYISRSHALYVSNPFWALSVGTPFKMTARWTASVYQPLVLHAVNNVVEPSVTVLRDLCWIVDLSLIHISEPTRLGMISYAVFCLKKKNKKQKIKKKT